MTEESDERARATSCNLVYLLTPGWFGLCYLLHSELWAGPFRVVCRAICNRAFFSAAETEGRAGPCGSATLWLCTIFEAFIDSHVLEYVVVASVQQIDEECDAQTCPDDPVE
jgi:hypothetical protein